jgi:hypothetical protein
MVNTLCTFYDPATGAITGAGEVSEDTLEGYFQTSHAVRLDVLGDSDTHYIDTETLELLAYTSSERAAKQGLQRGWVWQMPQRCAIDMRTLAIARAEAWARVKAARDIAEKSDFTHGGNVYQADRERINGAVTAAILSQMSGAAYSITWTLSNNTTVDLDGAQMMAVGAALAQRVKEVFDTGVALREAIAAVSETSPTTNAQLDAINWPSQEP